jgi:hypothetical protein
MPQIAHLQQRLENILKPTLRLVPTKPRLKFSGSAPRLASTFDIHTEALESFNLSKTREETGSQTLPSSSVVPSTSMTSHCPSSSPSSRPALHPISSAPIPLDNNTRILSIATHSPHTPTQTTLGDTKYHAHGTTSTNNHEVLHAVGSTMDPGQGVAVSEPPMVIRASGPPQRDASDNKGPPEAEHWAAAVDFTARQESNWREVRHWRGFVLWVCICLQ